MRTRKRDLRSELAKAKELRPRNGRPKKGDDTEKALGDQLAVTLAELKLEGGLTAQELADHMDMSVANVRAYLARAKGVLFDTGSREGYRMWILMQLEEQVDRCRARGNDTEVRLTLNDMGKFLGLVSTGGNTLNIGTNINAGGEGTLVKDWIARQQEREAQEGIVDAEVVEGQVSEMEGQEALPLGLPETATQAESDQQAS